MDGSLIIVTIYASSSVGEFAERVFFVSEDPSAVFLSKGVWDCFKLDLVAVLLETNGVMKIGCGRQANAP